MPAVSTRTVGMGNCGSCDSQGDSGHELVLVHHKLAWPRRDRTIHELNRYFTHTPTQNMKTVVYVSGHTLKFMHGNILLIDSVIIHVTS